MYFLCNLYFAYLKILFLVNFNVAISHTARLRSIIFNQERLKNSFSLTKTHVVRKGEHDGDPSELHHAGDVSAVRGRPVCNESM